MMKSKINRPEFRCDMRGWEEGMIQLPYDLIVENIGGFAELGRQNIPKINILMKLKLFT